MRPRRLAWAGAGLVWASAALAAAAPASDAAKLERQQAAESKKAKEMAAKAAAAQAKLSALSANLAGLAGDRAAADAAREETENRLLEVQSQADADAEALARSRDALERLVVALIQNEPAASAGLLARRTESSPLAGLFTRALAAQAADTRNRIAEAELQTQEIALQRASLIDRSAALQRASAETETKIAATARERADFEARAEAAAARSRELARQARDLRDLAERAAAAQKRAQAAVTAVAPGGKKVSPAAGAIASRFGAPTKAGSLTQGMTLRTAPGARVVAPAAATVTYSGPFRSYGRVLILDQGNGYVMILTGLDSAFAGAGDKVAAGALIGQMAQAGKTAGATNAPELYFEVRQAGRPIDPERWLGPT